MFPFWGRFRLVRRSVPKEWEMAGESSLWLSEVCVSMTVLYSHACVLPTGSCRHNSNQEDWRLPPPALEPGQTAANDRGDNGQRQGAGPDRAHLLAVHKWRTGAEAQVILPLFGCSSFWLSSGHPAAFWAQSVFLGIGWGTRHPHGSRSGCSPDLGPLYLRLISENLLTK